MLAKLHRINKEFYQTFAGSFAATRRRIQPGIRQVLQAIPPQGNWLDIGCGSGALAVEWMRQKRRGIYCGVDFSRSLIETALTEIQKFDKPDGLEVTFTAADLTRDGWQKPFELKTWDGAVCFAVLHHIPGTAQRQALCAAIAGLLQKQQCLFLSVWQLMNSSRLVKRIQPWALAGIDAADVEEGDVLMDWLAADESGLPTPRLRYVHLFSEAELATLAESSGFNVAGHFYSDGHEGNLGLYQVWKKN